jgi:NADPH:quinone reductase
MKAAWYERQGAAGDGLVLGEMEDAQPRAGEVRIRVAFSGVNPGDIKKREDSFHVGMPYPRVIPHSDSSGIVDEVGEGVPREWIGLRVWCYGAQSYRPFGTAAEYTVFARSRWFKSSITCRWNKGPVSASRHNRPSGSSCHRSNRGTNRSRPGWGWCGGSLCQGVQLAHRAGARVIATCRSESDKEIASRAGVARR